MKALTLTLALLCAAAAARADVTFVGRLDGPNNVDAYQFAQAAGDISAAVTSGTGVSVFVGLYLGDRLLAVTGPGENLYANGAGGVYSLVVTGTAAGSYSVDVASPATAAPEPVAVPLLAMLAYSCRRPLK